MDEKAASEIVSISSQSFSIPGVLIALLIAAIVVVIYSGYGYFKHSKSPHAGTITFFVIHFLGVYGAGRIFYRMMRGDFAHIFVEEEYIFVGAGAIVIGFITAKHCLRILSAVIRSPAGQWDPSTQ
jgi:hypothetical protein